MPHPTGGSPLLDLAVLESCVRRGARLLQKAGSCGLLVCAGGPHWSEVLGAAGLRPAFAAGARLLQKAGSCGLLVCAGSPHRGEVLGAAGLRPAFAAGARLLQKRRGRARCGMCGRPALGRVFGAAGLRAAFAAGARLLQKNGVVWLLAWAGGPRWGEFQERQACGLRSPRGRGSYNKGGFVRAAGMFRRSALGRVFGAAGLRPAFAAGAHSRQKSAPGIGIDYR